MKVLIDDFDRKFLAFAESKPADEIYVAGNPANCALTQFVKATLGRGVHPGARGIWSSEMAYLAYSLAEFQPYPQASYTAAVVEMDNGGGHTWGGTTSRLVYALDLQNQRISK